MDNALAIDHLQAFEPRPSAQNRGVRVDTSYDLGFILFILLTGNLFVRLLEIIPEIRDVRIYRLLLVACVLTCGMGMLRQLSWRNLATHPATLCVLALLPAIILSHHGIVWRTIQSASDFSQVLLYYLVLITTVNTVPRLRILMACVVICLAITSILALSQYHGILRLDDDEYGISVLGRGNVPGDDEQTGEIETVQQLRGSGVFSDPNDFASMLAAALLIDAGFLFNRQGLARLLWMIPVPILVYAFALTRSRGGFLALLGGLIALSVSRLGWRRTLPAIAILLPAMLFLFAGRQTNINLSDPNDTAAGRMQIWSDALVLFRTAPVFGIGMDVLAEQVGHVAHNSFVQCFAELGLVGGTLFVGAVCLPLAVLRRRDHEEVPGVDIELRQWRPYLLACLVAYAVGCCSLTRCYTVTTYFVLGLGTVYCRLLRQSVPSAVPSLSAALCRRVVCVAAGTLILFYGMIRVLLH